METNKQNLFLEHHITFEEARKKISEMNLINNFLFDSSMENEEDAKIVAGNILKAVLNRDFKDIRVISQKQFNAVDTQYHSIKLDVYITENSDDRTYNATIFNIEMEDRSADKATLPKRNRFYGALHDSKLLESGTAYDKLPDFISITISSYDPFSDGDMCYVAETILTSHPTTKYDDGLTHLYLYCKGRANTEVLLPLIKPPHNGKKLQEMLHYILTGEKPEDLNQDINDIDKVVTKIKKRGEVTTKYMRQWEREQAIAYEVAKETKVEDALEMIRFARDKNISDEETRTRIRRIGLDDTTIDELFIKISAEMPTLIGSENN